MSPDWTLGRGIKYVTKLAVFIIVPGLHQMACKRWVLGILLFTLYVVSKFIFSNSPFEYGTTYGMNVWAYKTANIVWWASVVLLVFGLRRLEFPRFKIAYFAPVALVTLLMFLPLHDRNVLYMHVVKDNAICGKFCKNDILLFDYRDKEAAALSPGDYVMVEPVLKPSLTSVSEAMFPARVMMVRTNESCLTSIPLDIHTKLDFYHCVDGKRNYRYDFMLLGGPDSQYKTRNNHNVTPQKSSEVVGVNLKKIGNTHEYMILSDPITDVFGNTLLAIYKWTNINLFGYSTSKQTRQYEKPI